MKPNDDFSQLSRSVTVLGDESKKFVLFVKALGLEYILTDSLMQTAVVTDSSAGTDFSGMKVSYPYVDGLNKKSIKCDEILTYAVENNGADVVAKNVRIYNDSTSFELLTSDGIGRVYVDSTERNVPKYTLALACALLLSGLKTSDAIELVSKK